MRISTLTVIRIVFWAVAILLGASEAWTVRHEVISDGVSYLAIAMAYVNGDWSQALNAYWSPLLSWLVALLVLLLRPSPYWQVATLHLVLFLSYVASLFAFEFFTRELILSQSSDGNAKPLPPTAIYIAGYCSVLFAGLSMVGNWFCSPDMMALALTLFLSGVVLRIRRTGGSTTLFLLLGIACALAYFARAAFVAPVAIYFAVVLVILYQQHRDLLRPALIMAGAIGLLTAPFIGAISKKEGYFTIGDAGKLNYAWEVDGAHRWVHWQGEPGDIGTPKHPTTLAVASPKTFVFPQPAVGSYAPWIDPSYWYAGVKPKLKLKEQTWLWIVNFSVLCNIIIRSPLFFPVCLIAVLTSLRLWWRNFLDLWVILLPIVAGIALYSLVYIERRYLAANLLVIWMAMLVCLRVNKPWLQKLAPIAIACCALLFAFVYVGTRLIYPVKDALSDLVHHREKVWNLNYLLAQRLLALGLCPGDEIGYVGPAMNAEWARLAHLRIVAEVPLMYSRSRRLLNNLHIDDPRQIERFFQLNEAEREPVLRTMRAAGAKMVVTDGYFSRNLATHWQRVLPQEQPHLPVLDKDAYTQQNSRYLWLVPVQNQCGVRSGKS